MIHIKIVNLEDHGDNSTVLVKAILAKSEFKQLVGNLDNVSVFSPETIREYASFIRTGHRHSFAKYLLLPSILRRQFKTTDYDFEKMHCGKIENSEMLFVIYAIPRKIIVR